MTTLYFAQHSMEAFNLLFLYIQIMLLWWSSFARSRVVSRSIVLVLNDSKKYTGNVMDDFSLTFSISESVYGKSEIIDLVPNRSKISVTNDNRASYIIHVANFKLNKRIEQQCKAFFSGLIDLIHPSSICINTGIVFFTRSLS